MLKKKDWKELLQEFSDKVGKRELLIQSKIDGLQEQGAAIQTKIKENSNHMIELEMNGDMGGAEKVKNENRQLRLQLEEIQDSIAGYESQFGTSHDFFIKDLDKIRDAANKAEEERTQWRDDTISKRNDLEAKIKKFEEQILEINHELRISKTIKEELCRSSYLTLIDPRANSLSDYDKSNFMKCWLSGVETEHFFKRNA